jgi:hypothetical protein
MVDPYERERTGLPRWLKVGGIAVLLLAVLVAAVLLVGGGEHGPRLHSDSEGGVTAGSVLAAPLQPLDGHR